MLRSVHALSLASRGASAISDWFLVQRCSPPEDGADKIARPCLGPAAGFVDRADLCSKLPTLPRSDKEGWLVKETHPASASTIVPSCRWVWEEHPSF